MKIGLEPLEISIREKIGRVVSIDRLNEISDVIEKMHSKSVNDEIKKIRSETVFNIGKSAEIGSEYIKKILYS